MIGSSKVPQIKNMVVQNGAAKGGFASTALNEFRRVAAPRPGDDDYVRGATASYSMHMNVVAALADIPPCSRFRDLVEGILRTCQKEFFA